MKIKVQLLFGCVGLIALTIGLFLMFVLLQALKRYGAWGYISLGSFLFTGFVYIKYEINVKSKLRIIDEAIEDIKSEYKNKLSPEVLQDTSFNLKSFLIKKYIDDNKFDFLLLFGNKKHKMSKERIAEMRSLFVEALREIKENQHLDKS